MRNLSDKTIKIYLRCLKIFLKSNLSPTDFILSNKNKRNNIAMLRILYPDLVVKFPRRNFKPKILPSKEQMKIFYEALPDKYKPLFIRLAESGLRIGELLNCDADKENKMLIPKKSNQGNKHSWVSFYQTEFEEMPKITPDALGHVFKRVSRVCGVSINPHLLRAVFAREMASKGIQDIYIDAFCGRVPSSVLARHYTDFSLENLKKYINALISRFFSKSMGKMRLLL